MEMGFAKLKAESLKELFIKEIEAKIISGQLKPGDRLPPERELASLMGSAGALSIPASWSWPRRALSG